MREIKGVLHLRQAEKISGHQATLGESLVVLHCTHTNRVGCLQRMRYAMFEFDIYKVELNGEHLNFIV